MISQQEQQQQRVVVVAAVTRCLSKHDECSGSYVANIDADKSLIVKCTCECHTQEDQQSNTGHTNHTNSIMNHHNDKGRWGTIPATTQNQIATTLKPTPHLDSRSEYFVV